MPSRRPTPPCDTIETAIHALSELDWARLRQAARILAFKVPTMDAEGLLFEALERTLDGRRRWNAPAVDFVGHLLGSMRSIAHHEATRRGLNTVAMTSSIDLIADDDMEGAVAAEERLRSLREHFVGRDDGQALAVLDAMEIGCDGPTIREHLGLSQSALETIIRRIRRAAIRLFSR